jgi:hypothetical protein
MSLDDHLHRTFDALAARLKDEIVAHAAGTVDELVSRMNAERAQAASEARADAEREAAERLAAARAEVERDAAERLEAARAEAERTLAEQMAAVRAEVEREAAARLAAARAEVERDLTGRLNHVRAEVEREMLGRLTAARAEGEGEMASRLTAARAEAEAEAEVRAECEHEQHTARDRVLGAIRSMDRADSLSGILDVLVSSASAEAARAGIFLTEGDRLRSWRCAGFGPVLDEGGALNLPLIEAGIVAEAARTGFVANAGGSSPALAPFFAELSPGRRAVAVPLQMNGHVFAVLYADQGPVGDIRNGAWPATLEVLARYAARSLEAVTAYRLAQVEASV